MTYYCEHYISPMEMNMPESTDTVHINRPLNLNQIAGVCKIDIDQLRALNPEFKKTLSLEMRNRMPCDSQLI